MRASVWTDYLLTKIKNEHPELALITDCRFENEVLAVKEAGGYNIRLRRTVREDSHPSETALDQAEGLFDLVVDNRAMTAWETFEFIYPHVKHLIET